MKKKLLILILAAAMCAAALTGCEGKPKETETAEADTKGEEVTIKNEGEPIRLSTMTDEESRIIGSMMQQVLEANGYEVEAKIGTYNNTTLAREALSQKQIDLSMDYTGRGMMFIEDVDITKYQTDFEVAFQTTKEADKANGIEWLCYSEYNNTDGLCVKEEWAEKNNIKTLDDFAEFVNNGGEVKIAIEGADSYVTTSPTCLPGWQEAYGFELNDSQLVIGVTDAKSMVADGTDGVNAAHTYTTAGALDALGLVVLEDTKVISPVYSPAPIASSELIEKYPELTDLLKPIFDAIDEGTIRALNTKLSVDGISESEIAKEFLTENDL